MNRPVLILRPEPGARRTAESAMARGLRTLSVPLFEVAPIPWFPPDPVRFDAIMFTSANAVRTGGRQLSRYAALPAYAVGAATAEAVRRAGFADVREGPGDARALAETIERDGILRVLHPCGVERRESAAPGVFVERVEVYESRALPRPSGLDDALGQRPLALLHSPRAAERFAALVDSLGRPRAAVSVAAISPAAAAAAGAGWRSVEIAERPEDQALLAIATRLCD